jgi:hypothetical protein
MPIVFKHDPSSNDYSTKVCNYSEFDNYITVVEKNSPKSEGTRWCLLIDPSTLEPIVKHNNWMFAGERNFILAKSILLGYAEHCLWVHYLEAVWQNYQPYLIKELNNAPSRETDSRLADSSNSPNRNDNAE